ncbi:MAG: tRNA dihydrouridine synthase [Candidatus Woesearchaeota archaeon]
MKHRIGNIKLDGRFVLAPLAGVNDIAFRKMCSDYGSALNFSEMINVNAIERLNKSTLKMADTFENEKCFIQLFGTRLDAIKKSIKILENEYDKCTPYGFDFNFGCPVSKIMNQGAGSALLKRPKKIGEILSVMRDSTDLPITAKIRLGITPKSANYLETAKIIERNGADALVVHGRYQSQGYSGTADWGKIKEIVDVVDIPVIANGDIVDEFSANKIIEETCCKFGMIGRAIMGNPFLFKRLNHFMETHEILEQKNKIDLFLEYLSLVDNFCLIKDNYVKFSYVKTHAMWFTKGIPNSAILRDKISLVDNINDLSEMFKKHQIDM